jgi:hypothetical protein
MVAKFSFNGGSKAAQSGDNERTNKIINNNTKTKLD